MIPNVSPSMKLSKLKDLSKSIEKDEGKIVFVKPKEPIVNAIVKSDTKPDIEEEKEPILNQMSRNRYFVDRKSKDSTIAPSHIGYPSLVADTDLRMSIERYPSNAENDPNITTVMTKDDFTISKRLTNVNESRHQRNVNYIDYRPSMANNSNNENNNVMTLKRAWEEDASLQHNTHQRFLLAQENSRNFYFDTNRVRPYNSQHKSRVNEMLQKNFVKENQGEEEKIKITDELGGDGSGYSNLPDFMNSERSNKNFKLQDVKPIDLKMKNFVVEEESEKVANQQESESLNQVQSYHSCRSEMKNN